MSEQISYEYYERLINEKIELTESEKTEIIQFMYKDGWSIKDTINHIDSVRRFNLKNKKGE